MKKLLMLSLLLGTAVVFVPSANANTSAVTAVEAPQIRVQIGRNRNRWNRRTRVVTRTRITRIGRYRYRETIRVTYLPNGRTRTAVISRVRLGRNW